jgi:hypothetical protein
MDLPLPNGMYMTQRLDPTFGYSRGIFVVPGSLTELARFVLSEWPKAGWTLGRGDSEAIEIEDSFAKPPAIGAFKAQAQFCSPGFNLMLLLYVADRSQLTIGQPGTQGQSPLPGGTPGASPSPSQ